MAHFGILTPRLYRRVVPKERDVRKCSSSMEKCQLTTQRWNAEVQ